MKKKTIQMSNKKGLFALSPLLVFVGTYLSLSLAAGDFYKVPLTVAFMVASVYAIAISGGLPLAKRVDRYSCGFSCLPVLSPIPPRRWAAWTPPCS